MARQLPEALRMKIQEIALATIAGWSCLILDHRERAVLEAEALQEPQDDGGSQNDGAGTLDEGPAALPSSAQDVAPCGTW